MDRLRAFESLLRRWNVKINLVSTKSLDDYWERHVSDSLGLIAVYGPSDRFPKVWLDLGSGAGFPIVPLAIAATSEGEQTRFFAIESDHRKAAFLREAARILDLPITVVAKRIEQVAPIAADVISARALAELATLLNLAERHCAERTTLRFLKGLGVHEELTRAAEVWQFNYQNRRHPLTDRGYILGIDGFVRS